MTTGSSRMKMNKYTMTEKKKENIKSGLTIGFGIFSLTIAVLLALFPQYVKTVLSIYASGLLVASALINLIDSQSEPEDDGARHDEGERKEASKFAKHLGDFLIHPLLPITVFCLVSFCRWILNATFTVTKTWLPPFRLFGAFGLFLAGMLCFWLGVEGGERCAVGTGIRSNQRRDRRHLFFS